MRVEQGSDQLAAVILNFEQAGFECLGGENAGPAHEGQGVAFSDRFGLDLAIVQEVFAQGLAVGLEAVGAQHDPRGLVERVEGIVPAFVQFALSEIVQPVGYALAHGARQTVMSESPLYFFRKKTAQFAPVGERSVGSRGQQVYGEQLPEIVFGSRFFV